MPKKKRTASNEQTGRQDLNKHVDKLWEQSQDVAQRLQDIEIHLNLLTRLVATICVEKMGMRVGVLKRLVKRIEKEAIRESQIRHLEDIYNLPHTASKKQHPPKGSAEQSWGDIS